MIKILIADDHVLIREGFKKLIGSEFGFKVVGEASHSAEVLSFLRSNQADVVVLDINMPGRSGLDILEEIKQIAPQVRVLMLSIHPEHRFALRALKAGAAGYISKESAPEELVRAIHKIMQGRKYISENLAEELATDLLEPGEKLPHEQLSNREFQVMLQIAEGKTVSQIADQLGLSISTINTYRARIFDKMKLRSNAEIIRYALKNHLIE